MVISPQNANLWDLKGRLENDLHLVIKVHEVEIKIVFRATTLSQTVLEAASYVR